MNGDPSVEQLADSQHSDESARVTEQPNVQPSNEQSRIREEKSSDQLSVHETKETNVVHGREDVQPIRNGNRCGWLWTCIVPLLLFLFTDFDKIVRNGKLIKEYWEKDSRMGDPQNISFRKEYARLKFTELMHTTPKEIKDDIRYKPFQYDTPVEKYMADFFDTTVERGEVVIVHAPAGSGKSSHIRVAARNHYLLPQGNKQKLRGVLYINFGYMGHDQKVSEFVRKQLGDEYCVSTSIDELVATPNDGDGQVLIILDQVEKLANHCTGNLDNPGQLDSLIFELAFLSSNSNKKVLGVAIVRDKDVALKLLQLNELEKIRPLNIYGDVKKIRWGEKDCGGLIDKFRNDRDNYVVQDDDAATLQSLCEEGGSPIIVRDFFKGATRSLEERFEEANVNVQKMKMHWDASDMYARHLYSKKKTQPMIDIPSDAECLTSV